MGKKTKVPEPTNPVAMGQMQSNENSRAWEQSMQASHPNQVNNAGSLTWTQDPATGQWTQTSTLNPGNEYLYNKGLLNSQSLANMAGNLMGDMDNMPIELNKWAPSNADYSKVSGIPGVADYSGAPNMPKVTDYSSLGRLPGQADYSHLGAMPGIANYDVLGAIPQVGQYDKRATDLTRQLMQPGLDQTNNAARARAAAMGLGAGSGAGNNFMEFQNSQRANDAALKSALAGINQGNIMFGQGMQRYQQGAENLNNQYAQGMGIRQQGMNEANNLFNQSLQSHQMGANDLNNQFAQGMALRQQGVGELNNQFTQGMQGHQQGVSDANNLFGQMMQSIGANNQATMQERQGNMAQLSGLMGLAGGQSAAPQFNNVPNVNPLSPTNWQSIMSNYDQQQIAAANARNSSKNSLLGGLMGIGGSILGGPMGGSIMGGIGSMFGGGGGSQAGIINNLPDYYLR